MNWKAALAPLALLAVLLGGNALVAQVQGDLETQLQASGDGVETTPGQTSAPPLRLNNLKLPSDLPVTLPPGTKIDPEDLSKITLPDDLDVTLPDGFDLSDLDFNLPEDFDLQLPEGTTFDPITGNLSLPNGGRIQLPDGTQLTLPPGTNMTLPRELVDRLLAQGLPAGTLGRDKSFHVEDLPPGLNVKMDPPRVDGGGTLRLPGGTQLTLPRGVRIPPEALAGLLPFILPEGTLIDVPPGDGGGFALPEPDPDAQPERNQTATPDRGIALATDIDAWPARIEKGKPFKVEGYVRESASGRDVAGAPVVIYMNETKAQPGVMVGRGVSDASGRFSIDVSLPTDKPARQYQLVNAAGPFSAADGTRYAVGWGDPPIETFSQTTFTLDLPARDGLQSGTPVRGLLIDATGAPVPLARVEMLVDGAVVRQGATTAEGVFAVTHTFPSKGTFSVQLRFPGNAYYGGSETAAREILIEDVAIDVAASQLVERGTALTLAGRVLVSGVATPGKEVAVTHPFGDALRLTTDSAGRFSTSIVVPDSTRLGAHEVRLAVSEFGTTKTQRVEVWTRGFILLDAPERARVDADVPVTVTLQDARGNVLAGEQMRVVLSGPGGSDEARTSRLAELRAPQPAEGLYTITATALSTYVTAAPAEHPIELGTLVVDWDLPETVVRGRDAAVSATVTFAGKPLPNAPVLLGLFTPEQRFTSSTGRAEWTVTIPKQAPLGSTVATLALPEEGVSQERTTRVVAIPTLDLALPDEFSPGGPLVASVKLLDDLGEPLASHRVDLSWRAGDWSSASSFTTDANGSWSGEIDTSGAPRAELAAAAHHPEQRDFLAADKTASVFVAKAATGTPDLSPLLWGIPLVVVGAAGGAGVLLKRRLDARKVAVAAQPAPTASVLHAPGFDLDVGIPDGEPLVWGIGEPLALSVRATGESAGRRDVRLQAPGLDRTVALDRAPTATSVAFATEGAITLRASRTDDAMAAPVTIEIGIVEYRKEISREFDLLLERARGVEQSISKQSTAQEVEWMLSHRLGPASSAPLAEMALVMDVANYSGQPIARADYLRFVRAVRALDPLFGGRA